MARLALARDILGLRAALGSNPTVNAKHLALTRITAVRRVLLGREPALIDRLLSPATAGAELQAMADAVMDLDTPEKAATAAYVGALVDGLTMLQAAERGQGLVSGGRLMVSYPAGARAQTDAMIDACVGRGRLPADFRERLPALQDQANAAMAIGADDLLKEHAPDVFAAREEAKAESERLVKVFREAEAKVREIRDAIKSGRDGHTDQLIEQFTVAKARAHALYQEYMAHWGGALEKASNEARQAVSDARAKLQAPLIAAAKAYTDSVIQASTVTPEQATAWAEAQEITPQARARLKKIGYDLKAMRRDMADFYRLSGGRVVKVKVHSKGDKRANATNISDHGKEGVIHLDSRFDKRVLWHELAHHIEADPVAKLAAGQFIRRRSEDGKAYSLRSLTGNKGYRSNEAAYKDHFFDHYVGKIYRDGSTEVFSMAVESFSDPLTLGHRLLKDAETLEFVAGYLKQPLHPLAQAHMALRGRLIDMQTAAAEEASSGVGALQAELAARVEFVADTSREWLIEAGWDWTVKGDVIGRFAGTSWWLLSGMVRNSETNRKVNGYILARVEPNGRINSQGEPGWSLQRREFATRDLTLVKAALAVEQKTGSTPWDWQVKNAEYLRKILE